MTKGLTGAHSLAYMGVNAKQPPNSVQYPRSPGPQDYMEFEVGDFWVNTETRTTYTLVSKKYEVVGQNTVPFAVWSVVSYPIGTVSSLLGENNTVAYPLPADNPFPGAVRIVGTTTIEQTIPNISTAAINDNTLGVALTRSILQPPTTPEASGIYALGTTSYEQDRFLHNYGENNTFVGYQSGNLTLTATNSVGVGHWALTNVTTGIFNTCVGGSAGRFITEGSQNVCIGTGSGSNLTTGQQNTLIGALTTYPTTGNGNIIIGAGAGGNYTTNESNNLVIANPGATAESNAIRIGNAINHTTCRIAGIRGVTTGANDAIPVLIDSTGQLGTVSSSLRYKKNVEDMHDVSSDILLLRPVVFNYKKNQDEAKSCGLIAEEVETVMPSLVVYNSYDEPETVKYMDLIPMLLNEVQKLHKRVKHLEEALDGKQQL